MRRGIALTLLGLSAALPGAAQVPGPRLHRFIPGDLSLGELPPGVLSSSDSLDNLRRAAAGTGWTDRPDLSSEVAHPRPNWESISRDMDTETRSAAGTTLRYREVFTPSVAPFKRTHAYDAVGEDGKLTVRDPSLRALRVGEVPAAWSREHIARFTGDLHIELSNTAPTPIPSVAAEQALLSFHTEPELPVGFFEDSAGNLFARAETTRTVRIVYVLAAPQHAFVAPVGSVPDIAPGGAPFHGSAPAPVVPAFLAQSHEQVLQRAGVRRTDSFRVVLDALVRHFRDYRDADLPALPGVPANNTYLRLGIGGVGACRHRAYAFALTLHALGVPARYVGNEAHAWAEVSIPGTGWTRIDLGGWDVNLRNDDAQRESFVPENPDPFPRPANYTNGYSSDTASAPPSDGRHDPRPHNEGPRNQGLPEGREANPPGSPDGRSDPNAPPRAGGTAPGGAQVAGGPPGSNNGSHPGASGDPHEPDAARSRSASSGALTEETERHQTTLRLRTVSSDQRSRQGVVRGTILTCAGDARDETGAPIEDLPVVLELWQGRHQVPLMRDGRRESDLGTTVTDAQGAFSAGVMLPVELPPGQYSIRARTSGDAHHGPASAE